jgi:hypothetical protein
LRDFVSPEAARTHYGVALDDVTWAVNPVETVRIREQLRAARPERLPIFNHGARDLLK